MKKTARRACRIRGTFRAVFFYQKSLREDYFLLNSFGVTQVPVALATTIGSSKKSAAEARGTFRAVFFYQKSLREDYFLLNSFGVTQVPVALATTIGSSKKSAAEALTSFLETITFLASNFIFLEVFPILVISP